MQLSDVVSGFIAGPAGRGVGRGLGCLLEEDVELQRRGLNVSGGWVAIGESTKKGFCQLFWQIGFPGAKGENVVLAGHGARCSAWSLALRIGWEGCWLQKK